MERAQASPGFEDLHGLLLDATPLPDLLETVADTALASVRSFDSAGVALCARGRLVGSAATDAVARELDELQHQLREGPACDTAATGLPTRVDVMTAELRWPRFCPEARRCGVTSAFFQPLAVQDLVLGSLNLYSRHAPIDDADPVALGRFGPLAAVLVANGAALERLWELVDQLNQAIESRDLIGQAKGVLMAREGLEDQEAFDRLRKISQSQNIKVRDVARQVVNSTRPSP